MLNKLNDAIGYIERNLRERIDFGEAARIACVSQDSFQRFFSYMTGMTLTEYVRRRRLSLAAADLQRGEMRVIDVALQYGYESVDAFSRAFAKQHGITPSAVRPGSAIQVYPPASFHIVVKGARKMEFRLIEVEERVVHGISKAFDPRRYSSRETLRSIMWDEKSDDVPGRICEGRWNEAGNHHYDGEWYGVWSGGRYLIGREEAHVQKDVQESSRIPAGKYAAFSTEPGGLAWEELPKLFELIFDSWLPDSGYELRGDEIIEVYHLWTDKEERKKNRYYEVWIPVKEKAEEA